LRNCSLQIIGLKPSITKTVRNKVSVLISHWFDKLKNLFTPCPTKSNFGQGFLMIFNIVVIRKNYLCPLTLFFYDEKITFYFICLNIRFKFFTGNPQHYVL